MDEAQAQMVLRLARPVFRWIYALADKLRMVEGDLRRQTAYGIGTRVIMPAAKCYAMMRAKECPDPDLHDTRVFVVKSATLEDHETIRYELVDFVRRIGERPMTILATHDELELADI